MNHCDQQVPAARKGAEPAEGLWVVIAAYNEGRRLAATLQSLRPIKANIVVVDDGSTDDTGEVALAEGAWLLRHSLNLGQGAALQTGINFALRQGAGVVVTFDADGQHDPGEIPQLVEPISSGRADVALGSRFLGRAVGLPWTRRVVLKLGVLFTNLFSHLQVTDTHNGFRALSRFAATRIHIQHNRMAHASDILDQISRRRLRYCEVPVTIRYTPETLAKGQRSWNGVKVIGELILGRLVP